VRSAMASAQSVTHTCAQPRSCACVTSATMAHMRGDASSVETLACQTPTTARSALFWKKIEMAVQRSSTWVQQRLTCSMSGKSTASNGDDRRHGMSYGGGHRVCLVAGAGRGLA